MLKCVYLLGQQQQINQELPAALIVLLPRKDMPYITAGSHTSSASGPSGDSHQQHQCRPVESAESLKFSYNESSSYNCDSDNPGTFIKNHQMYFKITIETNS